MGTPLSPIDLSWMVERTNREIEEYILSQKTQIPPQYSALHIEWRRAYDMARKWEVFDIPERAIEVKEVEILERSLYDITLRIILSSWGYVRSFAPLLWKYLGIEWGYISKLRRISIHTEYGVLPIEKAYSLENIMNIPYSMLFHTIPTLEISDETTTQLKEWRIVRIESREKYANDTLVFLENKTTPYISLCKYVSWVWEIVRNNV